MKIQNPKSKIASLKLPEIPKYYLADIPQDVRARLLDLCFRRLWHEALELLHQGGFDDYNQDDLISFYHWAPKELPGQQEPEATPTASLPRDYAQPPPEQIEDIRKRLAAVSADVAEQVHHALKHEPIEHAANLLWKTGAAFSTAELYEYRKALFPPNALIDPYAADAPVLRPGFADRGCEPSVVRGPLSVVSGGLSDANAAPARQQPGPSTTDAPLTTDNGPLTTDSPSTNPSALLNELRDVITRYVVLPDMAAETLALWVVHTYAFTLRQVTTYIGVVSPEKRCGKTTLLELLRVLANRAITAANITPSAMFRVIQETQPTLLIDEADTFLQGRDEIGGILNAGYRQGNAYVVRLGDGKVRKKREPAGQPWEGERPREPEFGEWTQDGADEFAQYSCWCPKVMAAIGRLPDTLADRCIIITMQRKMPGEKCERRQQLNAAEYRKRCDDFVREHSQAIAQARPEIPSSLNDRAADIWEPLLAIADLAGGPWPDLARQAALKLSGSLDDEMTLIGYFLKDIRTLMLNSNVDRILSRDIIRVLNPMHNRPWEDLRRGREINEWWLGHKMSELGIHSKAMRVGESMGKGYMLAEVEAAFRRYVPNAEADGRPHVGQTSQGEKG